MTKARSQLIDARRPMQVAALVGLLALAISAPLLEQSLVDTASGYRRLGYAAVAAIALIGIWPYPAWRRLLVIPWPLVAVLAWCWFSLTWSIAPGQALVRLILTTLVTWIAFATVRHLGYVRARSVLRMVLAAALLLNYLALLLYPSIAIVHHQFHWSEIQWLGFMAHKNLAGALCAATVLVFVFDVERRWRLACSGIALAAALFVVMSVSRTAIVCGLGGLAAGGAVLALHAPLGAALHGRSAQPWRLSGYLLCALFFAVLIFFTYESDAFLGMMTDPDALSRRTVIWRQVFLTYLQQPWSGVGFASYWTPNADPGPDGRGAWLSGIDQGHNGILDILVQVGLPGLALVFLASVVWPARMLVRQIPQAPQSSALLIALLVLCLGSNFTESGLLERDSLWNVLMMLTLAMIAAVNQRIDPRGINWARSGHGRARSGSRKRRRTGSSGSASHPLRERTPA